MKAQLDTAFVVDLKKRTISIDRIFAAPRPLVWKAWTDPALLDQWWGPAPCRVETRSMEFRVGGRWLYAMILPDQSKHWCKADYQAIEPESRFLARDGFCDEQGVRNHTLPENSWETLFHDQGEQTQVQVHLVFDTEEDLKTIVNMGFKEGFHTGLNQLSQLLESLKKQSS